MSVSTYLADKSVHAETKISCIKAPGGVMLLGIENQAYLLDPHNKLDEEEALRLYPKRLFKRMYMMETDIEDLPRIKKAADQIRYMDAHQRTITHVLHDKDDTIRAAFAGLEDDSPYLVLKSGSPEFNYLDPGSLWSNGYQQREFWPGDGHNTGTNSKLQTATSHAVRSTEYFSEIEVEKCRYAKELEELKIKVAKQIADGEMTTGYIGAFKIENHVLYYDKTTTIEIVTEDARSPLYEALAKYVTEDFYEALRELCRPCLLFETFGPDPVTLRISGTEITVSAFKMGKAIRSRINGKLLSKDDYEEVLSNVTCYANNTEAYAAYVETVSKISLKYHRLNANGIRWTLATTRDKEQLIKAAARIGAGEEVSEVAQDIKQEDYKYPFPTHGSAQLDDNGYESHIRITVPFSKKKSNEKPSLSILGKNRRIAKGASMLDSLRAFMRSTAHSPKGTGLNTVGGWGVWGLLTNLMSETVFAGKDGSRLGSPYGSHIIFTEAEMPELTDEDKEMIKVFARIASRSHGTNSEKAHISFAINALRKLQKMQSTFLQEDQIIKETPIGVYTTAEDIENIKTLDDMMMFRYRFPEYGSASAETALLAMKWFYKAYELVLAPLVMLSDQEVAKTTDVLKRSEEILDRAIEATGSEYHVEMKKVRVTGMSGMQYWVDIVTGSVYQCNVTQSAESPTPVYEVGSHICIVKTAGDVVGHDYTASLIFALHSDSRTAKNIYTVNNLLNAQEE